MKARLFGALALAFELIVGPALAVVQTTVYTAVQNDWTDLGAGPFNLQTIGTGSAVFSISDLKPGASDQGFPLPSESIVTVQTNAHVWTRSLGARGAMASVMVAPVTSLSSNKDPMVGSASFTRPANTNPYNSGIICNSLIACTALQIPVAKSPGGSGHINRVDVVRSGTTPFFGQLSAYVSLPFSDGTCPSTAVADQSSSFVANGAAQFVGSLITSGAMTFSDGQRFSGNSGPDGRAVDYPFNLPPTSNYVCVFLFTSFYGFTPQSGETFTVSLTSSQ